MRRRLASGQRIEAFDTEIPPASREALPVVTFDQDLTLHWNNHTLENVASKPAHTDGDSVVYFKEANILHLGDLFFNGFYPFIDADSGGQ